MEERQPQLKRFTRREVLGFGFGSLALLATGCARITQAESPSLTKFEHELGPAITGSRVGCVLGEELRDSAPGADLTRGTKDIAGLRYTLTVEFQTTPPITITNESQAAFNAHHTYDPHDRVEVTPLKDGYVGVSAPEKDKC